MTVTDLAHIHLILNHVPTLGLVCATATFIVALLSKSDDLRRFSLAAFFVVALIAVPTYSTGAAARLAIHERPDYSERTVEAHQGAALVALVFMEVTGLAAWLGLWQFRRLSRPAPWIYPIVLTLSLVTVGLMARAANIGGAMSHSEIRSILLTGDERPGLMSYGSIQAVNDLFPYAWPAAEVGHFIGLSLLFGVLLVVNLRILGAMKAASFFDVHKLLPWGVLGFALNGTSGMFFVAVAPEQYTASLAFFAKLVMIVLAGAQMLYMTCFDDPWALKPGDDATLSSKVMAATQIFLWVGVLYLGRMLPYLGGTFTQ